MESIALLVLVLFSIVGFAAIFFTTFGTLIILLGAFFYGLLTNLSVLTIETLVILLILYLCGEVMEYALIIIGAKKFGASNAAIVGALIGGVIGAALGMGFLGIGLILGTFLGIFLGAFTVELLLQRDLVKSLKAGVGGLLGRAGAVALKVIIAVVMFAIIAFKLW